MVLRVWDISTLLDFAFLVNDFHQLGEGRKVFHSLTSKLCELRPSPHKLKPRDLQKHPCFTLASAAHANTCKSTIPTPATCMVCL